MLLGAVLVLLVLGGASPASAHAALRGTDPGDGTVLKSAPRDVTLTFTESVGLLDDSFRVLDPDNRRLRLGEAQHARGRSDTARVSLPAKLPKGTYVVAWRVVSADSHPVSGAFTFSVGKASATAAVLDTGPTEVPATTSLYNIARYLAYLAAALLIGTAAFLALCRPPDPAPLRTPLVAGWWTLLGSTLALLVLRAPYETGTGPATAFDVSALNHTLTTRPGIVLLARLALLPLSALFVLRLSRHREKDRQPRPLLAAGAVLAVCLALTWAAAEHASAGIQVPVALTSAVLHVLAMAVWLGGLAALLTTLYRSSAAPAAMVTRFSRLAFVSVTVLVVTGVYQSWRGLGSWNAFTDTSYGRLLTAKLVAVLLLLAAAGWSRRWTARLVTAEAETESPVREGVPRAVTAPVSVTVPEAVTVPVTVKGPVGDEPSAPSHRDLENADAAGKAAESGKAANPGTATEPDVRSVDAHRRGLRRSVLAEVAVGVAVLVITTVLTGTLPGRAAAEAAETAGTAPAAGTGVPVASVTTIPFDIGTPAARGKVQITLDPGRVGDNSVQAVVYGADDGLAAVPELRLSFTLDAQKIGPLDAKVTDRGGYWAANSFTLPIAGDWTMKATIRVSEVDQVSVTRTVRIVR
ncbi:copper resistance CopC/CopD family protein [Streptomyces sp. NPDC087903]|uniref:copper resistance CopC/CopD family protein n=1 Tax=Streptomyces sp. NPDC087903 TaxID=3365819 RepID=UPI00381D7B50